MTAAAVVRELSLDAGDQRDRASLDEDLRQAEMKQSRERALRLVGYRERSTDELRRRLLDDGYPQAVVEPLVERFVELGLVDDDRYSRMYVRSRLRSGYGVRRIAHELDKKGVPAHVVAAALDEIATDDPVMMARMALGGRVATDLRERQRLIQRLVVKGYDLRTAIAAVEAGISPESLDEM
jgi:regulatory protein